MTNLVPICKCEVTGVIAAGPFASCHERIVLLQSGPDQITVAKEVLGTNGSEFKDSETFPLSQMQKAVIQFGERVGDDSYKFRAA